MWPTPAVTRVKVKFFGAIRKVVGSRYVVIALPSGASVGDLDRELHGAYPSASRDLALCVPMVDHTEVDRSRLLKDGDEVAYLPRVSGG
jgi:molybdopterin synthase catalytic subunit